MMVGPIRLLMHLWWCTHIASRHVVFWFAYISDLGSRSTFVWSIILVLLCQHDFSDVWTRFSVCSLRLCISFSLHHHWAYPQSILFSDILCPMLTTILHWGVPPSLSSSILFCRLSRCSFYLLTFVSCHTGAYPHSWVHWRFADFSHYSICFLIFASHHTGAYPLSRFSTGAYPLSLGLPCLMLISWLSDPFVDLYELSPRASPYYRLV